MPRRSAKKKLVSDRIGGVLLGLCGIALVVALGLGSWWLRKSKVILDVHTNCPVAGPRAVHVIIFDRSDPVSPQQAQRVRQTIQRYKSEASFGQRFDLYTFEGDTKNILEPILQLCSPLRFEEANELIENPERIKRIYEERFSKVLDRAVDELLVASTRPNSPIIESLKAASITSLGTMEKGKMPLQVTLVSDMIQHSPLLSHFKTDAEFSVLSRSPAWAPVRPDFKGAKIDILYLLRPEAKKAGGIPIQSRGHQAFWEQLLTASNGNPFKFETF